MSETTREIVKQSGVVPYRMCDGRLEIVIITSRSGSRWWVPKGNLEEGMSPIDSAALEAWEEAGIIGEPRTTPLITLQYEKSKRVHELTLYSMYVERAFRRWPEFRVRTRKWVTVEQLPEFVSQPEICEAAERIRDSIEDATPTIAHSSLIGAA